MPNTTITEPIYFNRELSWLAFNRRVLEQAEDAHYPLLERLKFLSFVASNLDEFFEIRVAGLIQQVDLGSSKPGIDGLSPKEQLTQIRAFTEKLVADQYACWHQKIVPALDNAGIPFRTRSQLSKSEREQIRSYFDKEVQPVLTPLAIDPAHPFPQFANKSLNILLWLDDPDTAESERMLAFIPVPRILPRVVRINRDRSLPESYIFLSELIKEFAHELFPGYKIISSHAFRITRNSDLYIDEEEVKNLLQSIEEELHNLRKGEAVRLEIEDSVSEELLQILTQSIELPPEQVYRINGPINLMRLMSAYDFIERPDLKFNPFIPHISPELNDPSNIYENISQEDILLHHPFDSYEPVVDFVRGAASDPAVLAIKITLYRTSSESPIVKALIDAAKNNKQVTVLIELKARFDEANNINWAKLMEESGIHVVYGFVGLKTHCKCCLVVRREAHGLRRYAHLGTGNYHTKTARLYTDLSLLTANPNLTDEIAEVFNTLTGFAKHPQFKKLLVAPYNLHLKMNEYIQREAENARKGLPARIIVKCNSLIDKETIDNLYSASQAGVKIDMIIRGICALVPGVPGLSENIRVISILGQFLEHSRIYFFENAKGKRPKLYLGSADWMARNFYRRIEVVFPVENDKIRKHIIDHIIEQYLMDNASSKELRPDGTYQKRSQNENEAPFAAQNFLIEESQAASLESQFDLNTPPSTPNRIENFIRKLIRY